VLAKPGRGTERLEAVGDAMINQAFIDAFEPDRRSEYARQRPRLKVKPMKPATHAEAPGPARTSPLPSVREIDSALQVKYGATRYEHR
jgi:hypothetical protein